MKQRMGREGYVSRNSKSIIEGSNFHLSSTTGRKGAVFPILRCGIYALFRFRASSSSV